MKKFIAMQMPDGSTWGVPVEEVALSRATHYASEFDGDVAASLKEDTMPLFEDDSYEIQDWAVNNMNWSDFKNPQRLKEPNPLTAADFNNAWLSAAKELTNG